MRTPKPWWESAVGGVDTGRVKYILDNAMIHKRIIVILLRD
jgi:hypothetical protein